MSKSPKFRASRHLAARILLNRDDIVVHNDGTVRRVEGSIERQSTIQYRRISALVILEHLKRKRSQNSMNVIWLEM